MHRLTTRAALCICATVAGGLIAAGCGGVEDESAPAAAEGAGRGGEVEIVDFTYGPEAIEVAAGTELTWTNSDKAPHTATAEDESFDTGTLKRGDEQAIALDDPGTYAYYCRFHPFMKATVDVR
jgi:plastocyanin